MKKVLILDGGAAHAMAMAECLQKTGYWVAVMCDDKTEYGYHTKFANERFLGIAAINRNMQNTCWHF